MVGPDVLHVPDGDAVESELAIRSLRHFIHQGDDPDGRTRGAWPHVEPRRFQGGWHIDAICEHLEAVTAGEVNRLLITVPPRTMKSLSTAVFWPAWWWLRSPHWRWIFASYAGPLATRDSARCRNLIQSDWYQRLLQYRAQVHGEPHWLLAGDSNLKQRFENDRGGVRMATSVGGGATGEGGDVVAVDDPHKIEQADSEDVRLDTIDWWATTMRTRLNDPEDGAMVVVQQRVHDGDLAGWCISHDYTHLCLPMRWEPAHPFLWPDDPRTTAGALLWPGRMGEEAAAELERDMGSYRRSSLLQQNPAPATGSIFNAAWWRTYQLAPAEQAGKCGRVILSVDCAFKDEEDNDYVVMQAWGAQGADRYLLGQLRARMDFPTTVRALVDFAAQWPSAKVKLVEDKANGSAVIASLRRKISGLIPVNPTDSKIARARSVAYIVEAGNVWLPTPEYAPWRDEYVGEHARFPKGENDDQVDATTQALHRLESQRAAERSTIDPWA